MASSAITFAFLLCARAAPANGRALHVQERRRPGASVASAAPNAIEKLGRARCTCEWARAAPSRETTTRRERSERSAVCYRENWARAPSCDDGTQERRRHSAVCYRDSWACALSCDDDTQERRRHSASVASAAPYVTEILGRALSFLQKYDDPARA